VDFSIQPFFELEKGSLQGAIPSGLLQQVLELCHIFVDYLTTHRAIGQLLICPLFGGHVSEGALEVKTKFHP